MNALTEIEHILADLSCSSAPKSLCWACAKQTNQANQKDPCFPPLPQPGPTRSPASMCSACAALICKARLESSNICCAQCGVSPSKVRARNPSAYRWASDTGIGVSKTGGFLGPLVTSAGTACHFTPRLPSSSCLKPERSRSPHVQSRRPSASSYHYSR